jgi:group I intron endonuclease
MTQLQPFFSTIEIFIGKLNLTEIQLITKSELRGKSGIYGFLSKTNNKLYIGSSKSLASRFNSHIKGSQSNILLQRAINKYNLEDFIFIVFEYCEAEQLISREQFYFNELKPEFNILQVAGSVLGYSYPPESRAKLSESRKGVLNHQYGKKGTLNLKFGKPLDVEHKWKISEGKKGPLNPNFGVELSADYSAKISVARGGGSIFVYDTNGTLVNSFISARKAAKSFNCSHITISNYIKSGKLFQNKWTLSLKAKE